MRLVRCLPLLATLALTACEGTTLPPVSDGEGALRFDFAGNGGGRFEAVGAAEETPSTTHPWAYAEIDNSHWVTVHAFRPHPDGNGYDRIDFAFPWRDGAQTFDWSRCAADAACPGGSVSFVQAYHPMPETDGMYGYSVGVIRVTAVSRDRIQGNFAGRAHAFSDGAQLTLSDGSFDLPLPRPDFELF